MTTRPRRIKHKPPHISYQDFRTATDAGCCGGDAGELTTELASTPPADGPEPNR